MFRKLLAACLSAVIVFSLWLTPLCLAETSASTAPTAPVYDETKPLSLISEQIYAKGCIVIDALTGEVLFEKNADKRLSPASTTKIMTLLLALERSDPDANVIIPACVEDIGLDSTRVPVYEGEIMPMRDLWYGLIFRSGNDAANAIAELVSGSVTAFVDDMNARAKELHLTNTQFQNAHGYTQTGHYTTARDLATLTMYCLGLDAFREVAFAKTYTMQKTWLRDELAIAHNYSITDYTSSYYYKYARGIKTGYTIDAGQCYVGAAIKDGRELICVVLQSGWEKPQKWIDAKRLFAYGFAKLESR